MYSITEEFVAWLGSLGYSASTVPPSSGGEFVTVERTGGAVVDMVDHPGIAVQTWAQTEPRAEEMANEIRLAALTGPLPVGVSRIDINSGPYSFYDEGTRLPRYQIAFDVTCQLTD
jgi:hypothetical protein